ncbi:MAG: STAS domain-containing protein [Spirochaetota bacterium]|nr:STAS domain-containing protein [Spirochaetota bacterium]
MDIHIKSDDSKKTSMAIEGEMTIYSAGEIKNALIEYLTDCNEINIDLSMVSKIDTSGFQLLLLAKIESQRRDIPFKILDTSQEVENIFNLFGESY